MKKILIVFTLLCTTIINAQVSSISELIELSDASVYELTNYLQYNWSISRPTEVIEEGIAIGRYTYSIDYNEDKKQILQREIRKSLSSGMSLESTRFTSNDEKLYKSLLIQINNLGFLLDFERHGKYYYSRGWRKIIVYPEGHEEVTANGYYLISIPNTYRE